MLINVINLLCLWIHWGILSFPQGTLCGFLANIKSLKLFVLLMFSTSLVDKLWVCNCFGGWFLCLGPFESMLSFLWSSIHVHVLFVGICLFLVVNGGEFIEPETMYSIMFWCFPVWCFCSKSMFISALWPSWNRSDYFVILFIHWTFTLSFRRHILVPNRLFFSCVPLLVCFRVISFQLLVEFSFVVLECPVFSVLFYLLSISL